MWRIPEATGYHDGASIISKPPVEESSPGTVNTFILTEADVILFSKIAFFIVFIRHIEQFALFGSRECHSLSFVAPDFEKLFSNCVFRGVNVLNIRLKESLIRNAPLQEFGETVLVHLGQRFGNNAVRPSFALRLDGCLKPAFFDPQENFALPDMQRSRKTFQ